MTNLNFIFRTSVNFGDTIRCYGIAEGGVEEWDQAYQRFLISNSGTEKDSILSALSCSREPWILQRFVLKFLAFISISLHNILVLHLVPYILHMPNYTSPIKNS